jgi:putative Mg2+ transporter-C (MgtC) family protein
MHESDILIRLLLAAAVGGAIGFEREYLTKSAGFRTMILISIGSCLFTIFSMLIAKNTPDRIASNIVTGIGFLGAGVIFRDDNRVKGLTSAATIWVTAALGMGIANGHFKVCLTGTGIVLITLYLLTRLEDVIEKVNQSRNYKIVTNYKEDTMRKFEEIFTQHRLKFKRAKQYKQGDRITCTWIVNGGEKRHHAFIK